MSRSVNSNTVNVRELYTLVDQRMGEVNKSIQRLEVKFDDMASGRLTIVEKQIANMQGRMMYIPILISAAISLMGIVISLIRT